MQLEATRRHIKKGAQTVHHKPQAPRYGPQGQVAAGNAFPEEYYTLIDGDKSTLKRGAAACIGPFAPLFNFGKDRRPQKMDRKT